MRVRGLPRRRLRRQQHDLAINDHHDDDNGRRPDDDGDMVQHVQPGGFKFYSFTVAENGTVNVTLTSVGGTFVPSTVMLGLGLGAPAGTDCTTGSTTNMAAGSTAQVTTTEAPGVCTAHGYPTSETCSARRLHRHHRSSMTRVASIGGIALILCDRGVQQRHRHVSLLHFGVDIHVVIDTIRLN